MKKALIAKRIERIAKSVAAKKLVANSWYGFDKNKIKNIEKFGIEIEDAIVGTAGSGMDWASASYDVQYNENGSKKTITLFTKAQAKKFIGDFVSKKKKELDAFANNFIGTLASEAESAVENYVYMSDLSEEAEMFDMSEEEVEQEIIEQTKQLWG